MRITTTLVAAVLAGAALAGCSTGSPGTPTEPPGPEPGPVQVEIDFADLSLKLVVPGRFGAGELARRDYEECTQERYGWRRIPSGAADESELLFVGTTDNACPEQEAMNGRFPTWDSTDDLPEDAEPVTTPVGEGHRFSLDYTQCTNECATFDYDVVFVQLPKDQSFWIQSSGVDAGMIDGIVASITLS